mgnify:CR=1 FL=1
MKRPPEKTFIFGVHPLMEAITAGKEIEKVLLARDFKSPEASKLWALIKKHQIPVQRVPKEKLLRYTEKNHQGVIAFPSPITYQPLEQFQFDFQLEHLLLMVQVETNKLY